LAQRVAQQTLDTRSVSAESSPTKVSPVNTNVDSDAEDYRRSKATSFAAQEAMKTAEQAREAARLKKEAELASKNDDSQTTSFD